MHCEPMCAGTTFTTWAPHPAGPARRTITCTINALTQLGFPESVERMAGWVNGHRPKRDGQGDGWVRDEWVKEWRDKWTEREKRDGQVHGCMMDG